MCRLARDTAQDFQHTAEMFRPIALPGFQGLIPLAAHHKGPMNQDIEGRINRQSIDDRLFFQNPADRPGHGIASFHRWHLFFCGSIRVDQHTTRGSVVESYFLLTSPKPRALCFQEMDRMGS